MLILNHAKDEPKSKLKIPEPSWKPGDEPMGYDLEGAMVTPYPPGAPEKWYGPPPGTPIWCPPSEEGYGPPSPYPGADKCLY